MKNSLAFCRETITRKQALEVSYLILAERLKAIRDEKLYAGGWDNFEQFLEDPAMDMDAPTASKMINIHEKLVLEYKMEPEELASAGGWSKIAECLPVIETKEDAEKWIAKCQVLSKSDLRREITEKKKGVKMIDCAHKDTYQITVCRGCGVKMEEHKEC